ARFGRSRRREGGAARPVLGHRPHAGARRRRRGTAGSTRGDARIDLESVRARGGGDADRARRARRLSGRAPGRERSRARPPAPAHQHGRLVHTHHAGAPPVHIGTWTLARRPLIVGAVHGLAGSGALTALVFATLPSTAAQLTYMGLFGLGSTVGMAVLSGVLG